MFNNIILIGRLGQKAEAKTAQNNKEYVILNSATQESWKNDNGEYENRTEWHRVYHRSLSDTHSGCHERGSCSGPSGGSIRP
jgi:single-stranded DNA-binding protein